MRRRLIALLVALLLVVSGVTGLWWWSEARLESGFAAWRAAQSAAGWTMGGGAPVRGGWPLAARLDIPRMTMTDATGGQAAPLRWSAGRVSLSVAFLHPGTLVIGLYGTQRVAIGGAPASDVTAGHIDLSTPLDPQTPAQATTDIDIGDLRATLPLGTLKVARLRMHADATQAFSLSAADIALPPAGGGWPLGAQIASLAAGGTVMGAIPAGPGYAQAAAWRRAGGRIELSRLSLRWGPLGIGGTAALTLDARMQPEATAQLRIIGYDAALDALAGGGALTRPAATAAKAVLGLIARTPDGGGAPVVDAPVTLRGGVLAVGQFPLTRLPALVWPDAPG